jgi:hypothetical protein
MLQIDQIIIEEISSFLNYLCEMNQLYGGLGFEFLYLRLKELVLVDNQSILPFLNYDYKSDLRYSD